MDCCLLEAEIEFQVVEPGDTGSDAFLLELSGEVFAVRPEPFDVRRVIIGYDDAVSADP